MQHVKKRLAHPWKETRFVYSLGVVCTFLLFLCLYEPCWRLHPSSSKALPKPIVLNTWGFVNATSRARQILEEGGTSIRAIVEGCHVCESEQCDGTVGYGGSPDEAGETTLEGMIMDGGTMDVGSVAAMGRIFSAIRTAEYVLKHTKLSMLAGSGATRFGVQMGFKETDLHTNDSLRIYHDWLTNASCQPNYYRNVIPDSGASCGPYRPLPAGVLSARERDLYRPPVSERNHDTIGMISIDSEGNVAAGTSTNGLRFKISGRVGDSPIPGAGAYASEHGACAATGDGDVMLRFLPCYQAVESIRQGMSAQEAAEDALLRIARYFPEFKGGVVVLKAAFVEIGAAGHGWDFPYSLWHSGLRNVEIRQAIRVDKPC